MKLNPSWEATSYALHWSLCWARSVESIPHHPVSLTSILILTTYLCFDLPSGIFTFLKLCRVILKHRVICTGASQRPEGEYCFWIVLGKFINLPRVRSVALWCQEMQFWTCGSRSTYQGSFSTHVCLLALAVAVVLSLPSQQCNILTSGTVGNSLSSVWGVPLRTSGTHLAGYHTAPGTSSKWWSCCPRTWDYIMSKSHMVDSISHSDVATAFQRAQSSPVATLQIEGHLILYS